VKHASITLGGHLLAASFKFRPVTPSEWPRENPKNYGVRLTNRKRGYQISCRSAQSYVDITGEELDGCPEQFFSPLLRSEPYLGMWSWKGSILEHTGVQGQFTRRGILSIQSFDKQTPGWMRFKYPDWIESVKGKVQRRGQPILELGEMDGNKRIISII